MKKIVEVLLDRMIEDAKTCDLNLIRDNLKRVESDSFVETIITNTVSSIWLSADGLFEIVNDSIKDNVYKLLKIYNIVYKDCDKVAKEYCFNVNIDSTGDLYFTLKCDVDSLVYTSASAFDDYIKSGYLRSRCKRPDYSEPILFKHVKTSEMRFYVHNIRKHILRSE